MLEGLEVLVELHRNVTEEVTGKSPGDTLGGTLGEEAKVVARSGDRDISG